MVIIYGNPLKKAYTYGREVGSIFCNRTEVWPKDVPPSYYIQWTPILSSGTFSMGGVTYNFSDYPTGIFYMSEPIITERAFFRKTGLRRIYTNVEYLSNDAFYGCSSLSYTELLNCRYIGTSTFAACPLLSSVMLPNCEYLGSSAFFYTAGVSRPALYISVPNCSYYGDYCFHNRNLVYAYNMDFTSCRYIGNFAFCSAIGMAEGPDYPVYDFPNCSYIGSFAFDDCGMVNVKLSNVEYIGDKAFQYNKSLWDDFPWRRVSIYTSSVCQLGGSKAFTAHSSGYTYYHWLIYVPSSLVSAYKSAENWSYYSSVIYPIQ